MDSPICERQINVSQYVQYVRTYVCMYVLLAFYQWTKCLECSLNCSRLYFSQEHNIQTFSYKKFPTETRNFRRVIRQPAAEWLVAWVQLLDEKKLTFPRDIESDPNLCVPQARLLGMQELQTSPKRVEIPR